MSSTIPPQLMSGTVTSYLPMTSPWTPNPTCSSVYLGDISGSALLLEAFDIQQVTMLNTNPSCIPPEVQWAYFNSNTSTEIVLAPFVCPGGYYPASTTSFGSSTWLTSCCPSGYSTFVSGLAATDATCYSTITSDPSTGGVITYVSAYRRDSTGSYLPSSITTRLSSTQTVTVLADHIGGINVGSPNPPSSSDSPSTTSLSTTATPSPSSPTPSRAGSGLSTGSQAGIGVGVAAGVILVIVLVTLLYFRHRRRKRAAAVLGPVDRAPREMDGTSVVPAYELESKTDRPELEGSLQPRQELEGSLQPPQELAATEISQSHLSGKFDS